MDLTDIPNCPKCGKPMLLKTSRQGKFIGQKFWGCIDYPICHGLISINSQTWESGNTRKNNPSELSEKQVKEAQQLDENELLYLPRFLDIRHDLSGLETRFFQTVSTSNKLMKLFSSSRKKIDPQKLASFTQWRLDYRKSTNRVSSDFGSTMAVIEKILLRGSLVYSSPSLRYLIGGVLEAYLDILNADESKLKELTIDMPASYPRNSYTIRNFDSDAERIFYIKIVQYELLKPWICNQVPLSFLTGEIDDSETDQRVDFLLAYPGADGIVVEIDGIQHDESVEIDQKRDNKLRAAGFKVLRIKTSELNSFNIHENLYISEFITAVEKDLIKLGDYDSFTEMIYQLRAASQLQLSLLVALQTGRLSLEKTANWKIGVSHPKWIKMSKLWIRLIDQAVKDFIEIFSQTYELHTNQELSISWEMPTTANHLENLDVFINFDSNDTFTGSLEKVLTISDIYLPSDIAQTVPRGKPIKIKSPKRKIVEYFFDYIFDIDGTLYEEQWRAIERSLQGKDTILLLPTGGGKSVVFQLASLLLPGICVIVDPLIALIYDQIDNLRRRGMNRAVGITSLLDERVKEKAIEAIANGRYLFCYVAPERFQMKVFRESLLSLVKLTPVNLIAIDEAHCISEWGHDFRVSYLNIGRNTRNYCSSGSFRPPLLALTGTASSSVLSDMQRELEIQERNCVISPTNFNRENLEFRVRKCNSNAKEKELLSILKSLPGEFGDNDFFYAQKGDETNAGLVFYPHVNGTYGIVKGETFLSRQGFAEYVGIYSGKAPNGREEGWEVTKANESAKFKNNETSILVCTKAYGMGIDKPNIRYTIHMSLPSSIEAAYQEAGRAGRGNGPNNKAICYFVVSVNNYSKSRSLLDPKLSINDAFTKMQNELSVDDDVSRQLFFHNQAFQGSELEIKQVKSLMDQIGDLDKTQKFSLSFDNKNQTDIEKAVHRLIILNIVDDYVIDYSNKIFLLQISGKSKKDNLLSYTKYRGYHDKREAEREYEECSQYIDLPHKDFALYLVERLIKGFIYDVVEKSRRRSMSEIVDASQYQDEFKQRIIDYLNPSNYKEFLIESSKGWQYLLKKIETVSVELNDTARASELRGQSARLLESYPNNPSLLLVRGLAEACCNNSLEDVVFENFNAYLHFAKVSWGMGNEETISLAIKFINSVGRINIEIANEVILQLIKHEHNDINLLYALVRSCDEELLYEPVDRLLEYIVRKVEEMS